MKKITVFIVTAVSLALVGCDRFERVVGLGHRAQEEERRERDSVPHAEDLRASLQADRDSFLALIDGKLAVLSNRVAETESAIRTLQTDRAALSRELGTVMSEDRDVRGAGLERALASSVVNELAMKYLHADFSIARGEYAVAIAKARDNESEFKAEVRRLDLTYEGLIDSNPQELPAIRRARHIAELEREHEKLERRQIRLSRVTIPTGNVYYNKRTAHDREVRETESRMREIERMIDRIKSSDARERKDADQTARTTREKALRERNEAVGKLKADYAAKADVLNTVRTYTDGTLRKLEQTFVREAASLDEELRKSRERCLTLQGIRASVPKLSADGLRKLHGQVTAL